LALYSSAKEAMFIGYMLQEVYSIKVFPVTIYCDNKAVCDVLLERGAKELTKYMATKVFKIHERIADKFIKVEQVKSSNNIADVFTKMDNNFIRYRDLLLQLRGSDNLRKADTSCSNKYSK